MSQKVPLDKLDLSKIDDCFKWQDGSGDIQVFRIIRARDEPNALFWENVVIEPEELKWADIKMKIIMFFSVLTCFILLYFLME